MKNMVKMLSLCGCLLATGFQLDARKPRGVRSGRGPMIPQRNSEALRVERGQMINPRVTLPLTVRAIERGRRRQENAEKFCSHTPLPKKSSPSFLRSATSTLFKMLLGAGIGIGALYAYNNPAVVKAAFTSAKAVFKSAFDAINKWRAKA